MSNARRKPRQRREAPRGELKQPRPVWFVTLMAFVLPGSGQVFNGAPARGVIMQFAIVFGGFITYMLSTPETSPIGRMAGALAVYVFSVLDAHGIATRRIKAWQRIEAEKLRKAGTGVKGGSPGAGRRGGTGGKARASAAAAAGGPAQASEPGATSADAGATAVPDEAPPDPVADTAETPPPPGG